MARTLNNLIFSERRVLRVPKSNENNISLAATAVRNLEDIGFTIDQKGLMDLASASRKDIEDWYFQTAEKLNELSGNNHEFHPFYPNFPNEVMQKDELEMFADQICHYWFGYMPEGEDAKANIRSMEDHPVTILKTVSSDEETKKMAKDIFQNLLNTKQNLSEHERIDVLKTYMDNVEDWNADVKNVANRKNLGYLYAKAIADEKDISNFPPMVTGDVLRLAKYLSIMKEGRDIDSVNLDEVDQQKIKSLPRPQRRMLCAMLNRQKNLEEDVARNKGEFKALFHGLHVSEMSQIGSNNLQNVAKKLRNNQPLETYYSRLEKAFAEAEETKDMAKVLAVYRERPGEMIKGVGRLMELSEKTGQEKELLEALSRVLPKARVEDLVNLDQYLNARMRDNYAPIHNVKGVFVQSEKEKVPFNPDLTKHVKAIIRDSIMTQMVGKEPLGKTYIEDSMYKMALPFDRADSSDSMQLYSKGSRLAVERDEGKEPKNIRAFIWWTNKGMRTDNDLSMAMFTEKDGMIEPEGRLWYGGGHEAFGCYHSGDITNGGPEGGKGVSEFIDLNLEKLREHNIKYVQFYVNVYSGLPFGEQNCLFGWQERSELDRSAQFDPRAVAQASALSTMARGMTPAILDVDKGEIIWIDAPDRTIRTAGNINKGQEQMTLLMHRYGYGDRMSMGEMAELNIRANNGEITHDKSQAETIISQNPEKELAKGVRNITSKEQDIWVGKMMAPYDPSQVKTIEKEEAAMIKEATAPKRDNLDGKNVYQMRDALLDMIHEEMGRSASIEEMSSRAVSDFKNLADDIKEKEQEIRGEYYKKFGFESFAADMAVEEMKEKEYHRYPGLRDYMEGRTTDPGARDDADLHDEYDKNHNGIDDRDEDLEEEQYVPEADIDLDFDDLEL